MDKSILNINEVKTNLFFDSKKIYNDTGVLVKQGEKYKISDINFSEPLKDLCIPVKSLDGFRYILRKIFKPRLINVNYYCLCGSIEKNESNLFKIGESKEFEIPFAGELFLFVNDYFKPFAYNNNKGKFSYSILRLK